MPASRINMRKLKDALRLKFEGGQSHQQIASALGISKGVVTKYVGLAVAAGLDWQAIAAMDEVTLERRLLASPRPSDTYAQPDYGRIHQELGRKGVTLTLLWEEYCAQIGCEHSTDNPVKPWRYSQFCENYRQFAKRLKRSMRQVHRAGEKLFIDYAGPTIALVVNGQEIGRANIFVAAMGVSGYCFCLATPAQTAKDWLGATAQALTFYGGVSQLIVPDNPRALVTKADRYEPVLTETVRDFARHYGCSVLPARAYHPQDKPKVELSVLLVERWILARLRKRPKTGWAPRRRPWRFMAECPNSSSPTTHAPWSPRQIAMSRCSPTRCETLPATTAARCCLRAPTIRRTSPKSNSACGWWSAGYWRACANTSSPVSKKSTTRLHPCCNG